MTESRVKSVIAAGLSFAALSIPGVADAITAAGGDQAILAAFSAVWVVAHGLIDHFHGKASGGGTPSE